MGSNQGTISIPSRRRRHIPWRLYIFRVPMNGISASLVPCILFQNKILQQQNCIRIQEINKRCLKAARPCLPCTKRTEDV
jgi:hypothetical protein